MHWLGSSLSSFMISRLRSTMDILSALMRRPNMIKEMNWLVYAFVEATPISGPALIWTPQDVSLLMELPTVLVTPTQRAPLFLQYLRAINVSAVSPTTTHKTQSWRFSEHASEEVIGNLIVKWRNKRRLWKLASVGPRSHWTTPPSPATEWALPRSVSFPEPSGSWCHRLSWLSDDFVWYHPDAHSILQAWLQQQNNPAF